MPHRPPEPNDPAANTPGAQARTVTLPAPTWRLAFAACLVAVLVLSLVPDTVPVPSTGWDKANHALAFAVLALLGCRAYPARVPTVLAGLLLYGGLIECLQALTPTRVAEWADLGADSVGIAISWALQRLRALGPRR